MKKSKFNISEIVNIVLSIIAIVVALISFFGFFDILNIADKIPGFILALIGILLINSTLERKNELKKLDEKIEKVVSITSDDNLKKLEHITSDIPFTFKIIFKDFIDEYHTFFKYAINNQSIEFSDLERFKSSYIRTLKYKTSKNTTFYATSLPYKRYFWVNNEDITPIIKGMSDFTKNGDGKFERIFFLENGDIENDEVIDVLNKQIELGIKTYIINIDKVPSKLQKFFVVDGQDELAWEVTIDTKQRINSTTFTTSKSEIERFKAIYSSLINLDDIKLYTKN
ncbi:hypothetical protein [uncultured Psychroserpens sp.]|uniref:hypothetical protein n=1 Tax=uncultured Psychroserpens sp. TaxID=255436 RepID=UPI002606A9C2|nr:hypothetical protein [uncultured Psychroserpens sp.]